MTRRRWSSIAFVVPLTLVLIWSLAPYLWQALSSFKSPAELATVPSILPAKLHLDSYRAVFEGRQ